VRVANKEAVRRGHRERVSFVEGDFVAKSPGILATDVVTLDRVICCYPDLERLVSASASKAGRLYGAVYPRERWPLQAVLALGNWMRRMRGNAFRTYVHPVHAIDAALERQGLRPKSLRDTFVWRVAVYSR
jgi:hypothetical protein